MTDGRAVAVLAHLGLVQDGLRDVAVVGDRHAGGGTDAEGDDADAVVLPLGDEVADQLLGHGEAVAGAEVLRGHRSRRVEGDDDVDAVAVVRRHLRDPLRPRQRHDHQQRAEHFQRERQPGQPHAQRRLRRDEAEGGDDERAETAAAVPCGERDPRGDEQGEKEPEGVREADHRRPS